MPSHMFISARTDNYYMRMRNAHTTTKGAGLVRIVDPIATHP